MLHYNSCHALIIGHAGCRACWEMELSYLWRRTILAKSALHYHSKLTRGHLISAISWKTGKQVWNPAENIQQVAVSRSSFQEVVRSVLTFLISQYDCTLGLLFIPKYRNLKVQVAL